MQLREQIKSGLCLANNSNIINDQVYKKLIDASISELLDFQSLNITSLYNSKPDIIKEVYACFLTSLAEFARSGLSREEVSGYLVKECNYTPNRADIFSDSYERVRIQLQIKLGNIGTHLPHIVDVQWKIDYIVKTSVSDESEGPIFRVNLITEEYDAACDGKKISNLRFSCDSHELQDLVYKLKDAVRHCQKIASEH